jgi:outer membrane protein assembly factor BamB
MALEKERFASMTSIDPRQNSTARLSDRYRLRHGGVHCTSLAFLCGLVFIFLVVACDYGIAADRLAEVQGQNAWPQWRGQGSRAVLSIDTLPNPWPGGAPKRIWHAPLGTGWSSPVVANGRVFITDRTDGTERLLAFDADTGREIWAEGHAVDFDPHPVGRQHGNGPKGTPLVDEDKVYAVGIAGRLECRKVTDGSLVWEVNYPAVFGEPRSLPDGKARVNGTTDVTVPIGNGKGGSVPLFGYTGSPTLWRNLLVTPVGGERGGTIIAFDKNTGRPVWKALEENVSYSSPVIAQFDDISQIVVMTGPRVVGLAAETGALLWSHPFQIQYDESISTPAIGPNMVLVTATGRPLTALRITHDGGKWTKQIAWTNEILSSYLSSMVVADDYVYGMNDGGEFSCLRLADGKALWTGGNEGYYSSPIVAGKRLFALNERGRLTVLGSGPEAYQPMGASQLTKGETWTMPAIVGSRIYVRSKEGLSCFESQP